ncbi:MAG TPA: pilus assembly protein TadG-related protein [Terriglobales bacterium]
MNKDINNRRWVERGQVVIVVLLMMSIFLLGFVGLATDYTNLWFRRQAAQGAADAACLAGGMDLLLYAEGQATPKMNFTPQVGATITCASAPTAAPCIFARRNGYDGTLQRNNVVMTFPATVSGAPAKPSGVAVPYLQVDVTEEVPVYFSQLLTRKRTVAVNATATCGLSAPAGPSPIVVLHPTDPQAIEMKGAQDSITIVGGPQRSLQVNSSATPSAVSLATVDLHRAGPNKTGGDFAVFGGPANQPGTVNFGSTGHWIYPATPVSDPYAQVNSPAQPSAGTRWTAKQLSQCTTPGNGCYKYNGCPDTAGCDEYTGGFYSAGITVKNKTAIFQPGVYYLGWQGLQLQANGNVRTSTAIGDGTGGVVFYFSGTATVTVEANSGTGTTDAYYIAGGIDGNGVASRALQCPGGAGNPPELPVSVNGNVLLGPCSGPYGDPTGQYRGFVFFQDRSAAAAPQWQGGGTTLIAGFMYFHQCRADGTGLQCSSPGSGGYGTTFNLGGNPGSGSYAVGSVITDRIVTNGNPNISMILNPSYSFQQLKVVFLK